METTCFLWSLFSDELRRVNRELPWARLDLVGGTVVCALSGMRVGGRTQHVGGHGMPAAPRGRSSTDVSELMSAAEPGRQPHTWARLRWVAQTEELRLHRRGGRAARVRADHIGLALDMRASTRAITGSSRIPPRQVEVVRQEGSLPYNGWPRGVAHETTTRPDHSFKATSCTCRQSDMDPQIENAEGSQSNAAAKRAAPIVREPRHHAVFAEHSPPERSAEFICNGRRSQIKGKGGLRRKRGSIEGITVRVPFAPVPDSGRHNHTKQEVLLHCSRMRSTPARHDGAECLSI